MVWTFHMFNYLDRTSFKYEPTNENHVILIAFVCRNQARLNDLEARLGLRHNQLNVTFPVLNVGYTLAHFHPT